MHSVSICYHRGRVWPSRKFVILTTPGHEKANDVTYRHLGEYPIEGHVRPVIPVLAIMGRKALRPNKRPCS